MSTKTFIRWAVGAAPFGMMFVSLVLLPLQGPRPLLLGALVGGSAIVALAAGRRHAPLVFAVLLLFSGGTGLLFLLTDLLRPVFDEPSRFDTWMARAVGAAVYVILILGGFALRRASKRRGISA